MSTSTDTDLSFLSSIALESARAAGASYAELRVSRHRNQYLVTREEQVQATVETESSGFGLRVLVDGAWGFASSTVINDQSIRSGVDEAVAIARASGILMKAPVELAPVAAHRRTWTTPMEINPFDVPLGEKIELLLSINREALKAPGTRFCNSMFFTTNEWKYFASTEGSEIIQDLYRVWPSFTVTAVAPDGSDFQTRSGLCTPSGEGFEYCSRFPLLEDARKAGEDAVEKLKSPSVEPGVRDLVLMPSHTWLVIHESIGHATELDRALGFEANYAGTSFVTPDLLGSLKYASDIVTVVGDRTEPRGLATVGFDDEGVEAKRFDIIRDGQFVGYQTTREQAGWVGDHDSHACAYADNFSHVPMQRMPNVSLMPGKDPLSPEDLIAGVEDGIMIQGDGSWSIDQQRRNFQFGGQLFHRIKNGKIDGMLRDVAYQSMTLDFWNACDAICSEEHYELGGSYFCGKAQPSQIAPVSHGSAPARFRNINVINTKGN